MCAVSVGFRLSAQLLYMFQTVYPALRGLQFSNCCSLCAISFKATLTKGMILKRYCSGSEHLDSKSKECHLLTYRKMCIIRNVVTFPKQWI